MTQAKRAALLLSSSVLLSFAAAAQAAELRFASQGDLVSMDPYAVEEVFTSGFLGNVYEGLVRRTPDLKLEPALAESWEMLSPTQWRFHLRKGVTFHDGSPFTADDVIYPPSACAPARPTSRTAFRLVSRSSRWMITRSISLQRNRTRS
ncbi:ABC transporter substrate-binding protein [Pannonibacter sp. Pt2-lr]